MDIFVICNYQSLNFLCEFKTFLNTQLVSLLLLPLKPHVFINEILLQMQLSSFYLKGEGFLRKELENSIDFVKGLILRYGDGETSQKYNISRGSVLQ